MPTLAQPILAASRTEVFSALLPWLAALLGIVIVGGLIAALIRRWMSPSGSGQGPAMSLEDLRQLRRDGALSDAEFEAAKAALLSTFKAAGHRPLVQDADASGAKRSEPEQPENSA